MSSNHESAYDHRTIATRGLVAAIYDNGLVQTADVETHPGVVRAGVEVYQPFGFASAPPANGAVVVLIANGADHSDLIAFAAACPEARLGGLQPGEAAIYGLDGSRVHVKAGGVVEVLAATQIIMNAPSCTITCADGIVLDANVTISGSLDVSGNISDGGNITASGTISGH